ncbi:hypothetical protein [Woeseia oceani]|uniref:Uncharacterized protein n=1 Tax=Woeseia oceani TaxID=1548547 RepID=A0A193LGP7_9GAMM|nr:hypothetical protein [Woeseia oceani]ANO51720.1 hypothetical protein BA177_11380 [Woeseia oceani]
MLRLLAGTTVVLTVAVTPLFFFEPAAAMPAFAREYGVSCNVCHAAYPRLNAFGETFAGDMNMRLPNWKEHTVQTGDEQLALSDSLPLAIRLQAFIQGRDGESINPISGEVEGDASVDFQAPYLVKLLSSAPLTEHISYYVYAIFAEKGGNGEVIVEDAWFSHDDLFGTGVGLQLGQFQVSDLMFPREIRLTFQDYMAYRMAGITYDRGIILGREAGPLDISVGFVNGNGIEQNFSINSPGYRRADRLFDNDTQKSAFGRIGATLGPASIGLFGLSGRQMNAIGPAGLDSGQRRTDKRIVGVDVSGDFGSKWYWFGQYLWNSWDGFLDPAIDYTWSGGFAGIDYIHSDKWVFSALYNHANANDFENTDTVYEGIAMDTLTFGVSYYFMRNVKGTIEANFDILNDEPQSGIYYTGHLSKEHYILVGIDAAF